MIVILGQYCKKENLNFLSYGKLRSISNGIFAEIQKMKDFFIEKRVVKSSSLLWKSKSSSLIVFFWSIF